MNLKNQTIDIVVGGQRGDEAKAKVSYSLIKNRKYTHCIRFNGGPNAGHTIYHNNKKFVTHAVPIGVFHGIKSIIGPGCVLDVDSFLQEVQDLENTGISCKHLIKISDKTHIITKDHKKEDGFDTIIGTTKRGIGPAIRDKYARVGKRVSEISGPIQKYLIDFHEEMFNSGRVEALCEGAQGFYLDPHFGTYPFVTSTHCTVAAALLNGFPHTSIRDVVLCCKVYETYVGSQQFQPLNNLELENIQKCGNEVGATTGRKRQCNYLNLDEVDKSAKVNGANRIIFSKADVLSKLSIWKLIENNQIIDLKTESNFTAYIKSRLNYITQIDFSYSANSI